jgi:hypothetical protein
MKGIPVQPATCGRTEPLTLATPPGSEVAPAVASSAYPRREQRCDVVPGRFGEPARPGPVHELDSVAVVGGADPTALRLRSRCLAKCSTDAASMTHLRSMRLPCRIPFKTSRHVWVQLRPRSCAAAGNERVVLGASEGEFRRGSNMCGNLSISVYA